MLKKTWVRIGLIAGGIAGAVLIAVKIRNHRGEQNEEVNPPDFKHDENKECKTSISLAKPKLNDLASNIMKEMGYSYPKNDENESLESLNENDPHICSERDYVETYLDYDHHTCTWYPDEKRLVDLDDGFSILFPSDLGPQVEKLLYSDDQNLDYIYAVNPSIETVYEICISKETGYLEDLERYQTEVGDA